MVGGGLLNGLYRGVSSRNDLPFNWNGGVKKRQSTLLHIKRQAYRAAATQQHQKSSVSENFRKHLNVSSCIKEWRINRLALWITAAVVDRHLAHTLIFYRRGMSRKWEIPRFR